MSNQWMIICDTDVTAIYDYLNDATDVIEHSKQPVKRQTPIRGVYILDFGKRNDALATLFKIIDHITKVYTITDIRSLRLMQVAHNNDFSSLLQLHLCDSSCH